MLSAGQPKGKKPKEPAKHTHTQTDSTRKQGNLDLQQGHKEGKRERGRESVRALAETCAIIWLISANKFIESKCKIER